MAVVEGKCYTLLPGNCILLGNGINIINGIIILFMKELMHVELKGILKIFNYRLRTYEHEAMWGKALVTYDLETAISSSTRQAGIIQVFFFLLW